MTRRTFFASLVGVAVAPSLPMPPAAPAYSFQDDLDTMLWRAEAFAQELHATLSLRPTDDLTRYIHDLNRREHERLNAMTWTVDASNLTTFRYRLRETTAPQ